MDQPEEQRATGGDGRPADPPGEDTAPEAAPADTESSKTGAGSADLTKTDGIPQSLAVAPGDGDHDSSQAGDEPETAEGDDAAAPPDNDGLQMATRAFESLLHQAQLTQVKAAESALKEAETERTQGERRERQLKTQARLMDGQARSQWARLVARRAYVFGGAAVALGFAAITAVILLFGQKMQVLPQTRWIVAVSSGVLAWLFLVGAFALPGLLDARREQRKVEADAREAVAESADELDNAKDLVALIKANRRQMSAYDVLAQAQATTAFRNSQIAMAAGLIVLIAGAIVAISAPELSTKIATASLTAIGGALAGFIARTFLQTYSSAVAQLNFYFQQPLITSYLLTAQRLISELSDSKRDAALGGVISRISDTLIREWSVTSNKGTKVKRAPRPRKASS